MSCVSDLILQAGAEDQIVIVHSAISHQLHVFVLAVDGLHLTRHHADPGAQRQLGLILIAVAVTVEEMTMKRAVFKSRKSQGKLTHSLFHVIIEMLRIKVSCLSSDTVCLISCLDRWIGLDVPVMNRSDDKQLRSCFSSRAPGSEAALMLQISKQSNFR